MKPIFKSSLIKDVVISYVCMIVFPVMIILGMVFLLAGRYIYRAATESVTVTQQAVLELYKEEMRGSALALSRVVNMNGGTTIQDASGYDTQKQEQAMEQLYTMYQMLAAPEYKILDIHIYRKDGTAIIPKGEMRYSVDELRQKEWYQAALRQPGLVHTSLVEEDYFYRIRSSQEILEISAYAPREDTEAECIVLYRVSKIPDSIKNYNKSGRMGTLCLINGQGRIVADPGQKTRLPSAVTEKIRQNAADLAASDQPAAGNPPASNNHIAASTQQQISYRGIRYMILPLPEPGYYLVSAVNETSLFGQFTLFSLISMAVILCVVLMFIFYFKWYMNRLLIPLGHLTEGMRQVEHRNLDTRVEMCRQQDIARMISTFNNMVEQIKKLIHDKEQVEKEKYQEELHTLQSQMNPHFLMNTLNTLKFMAISAHYTGMQDMVVALENILAAVLNRDGGFYTVRDEQSVLESYIYIMQFRYMDSFEVDINLGPGILDCKVPKLILQPIVENCITHGFDNLGDRLGRITVTGTIQEGNLIFEITDNGKGMDQATVQRILGYPQVPGYPERIKRPENMDTAGSLRGPESPPCADIPDSTEHGHRRTIGVSNTDRRLKLNFGSRYGVSIDSKPGAYTRVTLTLPVITNTTEDHYSKG